MRASCIGKRVPLSKGSHCLLEFLKKTCYSDFYVLICDLLFLQKINSNKGREVSGNVTIILGVEFSLFLLLVFWGPFNLKSVFFIAEI